VDIKERKCGVGSSGSERNPKAGCYEHGYEPSGSIKGKKYPYQPSNWGDLKRHGLHTKFHDDVSIGGQTHRYNVTISLFFLILMHTKAPFSHVI
jgi:hypothetical protein